MNGRRTTKLAMKMDMNLKSCENENQKKEGRIKRQYKKFSEPEMKIATWNVRSIYEEEALRNLTEIMVKYKIEVVALQETKLLGKDIVKIGKHTLFKSGGENRMLGTGFILNEVAGKTVVDFEAYSDRMCRIRLRGKYRKISIVNIHAPSEEKDIELKQSFYEDLQSVVNSLPRYDIKIIIGDYNAKIGREEIYKNVTGGKSKHEYSNENGRCIIEFARENKMKIISTHFDHKDIHKATWISPSGNASNQIDHMLIEERDMRTVKDVRSYRGAASNSDHFLVIAKVKQNLPKNQGGKEVIRQKYNVSKLQMEDTRIQFEMMISADLGEHSKEENVEQKWSKIQTVVGRAAKCVLGKNESNKGKDWFDEVCVKSLEERNRARVKLYNDNSSQNREQFIQKRKEAKRICRAKKRDFWNKKIEKIENNFMSNDLRNFYQEVKNSRENGLKTATYCRGKDGHIIGEISQKLKRWEEHFQELLADEGKNSDIAVNNSQPVCENVEVTLEEPTSSELEQIISSLKNNKSAGESAITGEMLKAGGQVLHKRIFELILQIWKEQTIPTDWRGSLICPIHKKGDKSLCENYRGISLLDVIYKVFALILRSRLVTYMEDVIGEYQGGFRKGRSTIDQIFTVKEIINDSFDRNLELHILFIDFKQAYDSIIRTKMIEAMTTLKIPKKLIELVLMTLKRTWSKVTWEGKISKAFNVQKGLRQGDPLSTMLFNLVLEVIIRECKLQTKGTVNHFRHQVVAFADDIAIITRTKQELITVFKKLEHKAKEYGLTINEQKTKYLKLRNHNEENENGIQIQSNEKAYAFERVRQFDYLGVTIEDKSEEESEINKRLQSGSRAMSSLKGVMLSKMVSRRVKVRVYKTVIRPTVLYGAETWVVNKKIENKLLIWERKILRRIFGGQKDESGQWKRRTNENIYEMYSDPNIVKIAKARRIRWLGHVHRMSKERIPNKLLTQGVWW